MSSNSQPLSGNSITPLQRVSLNSLITSLVLDADSGNSSLVVQTGATTSLYIDKFSNVGINTTSPSAQFEIASSNGACMRLRYGTSSTAFGNIFMASNGNMIINSNTAGSEIISSSSFNLSNHNGSTSGLKLGGTLVLASALQLNYNVVTAGTAAASRALVLDSSSNITGINSITATNVHGTLQTAAQPNITSIGTLSSLSVSGSFTLNGGNISDTLSLLSGVTAGTAVASKVLAVDANKDIIGLRTVGVTNILVGSATLSETQAGYLTGITAGTASTSKAIVLNASGSITGITALSATSLSGTIQTAAQPNITSLGTLSSLSVNGGLTLNGENISNVLTFISGSTEGTAVASKVLIVDGNKDITGLRVVGTTTITVGSVTLSETQAGYISGITTGTAASNKAIILNGSGSVSGINSLSATSLLGTIQTANQPNITSLGSLTSLSIGSTTIGSTELSYISDVIAGTASNGKALVLNNSGIISGITSLSSTSLSGTIQTASQPNISSIGTLSSLTVSGAVNITSTTNATSSSSGGAVTIGGGLGVAKNVFVGMDLTVGGNFVVTGTSTVVNSTSISITDNTLQLNASPSGVFDSGILIHRFQTANDSNSGSVVGDTANTTTTVLSATLSSINLVDGSAINNYYNGWWVKVGSQIRKIQSYVASTKTISVETNFTIIPSNGASVLLYNRSLASFVWNESAKCFSAGFVASDATTLTIIDNANIKAANVTSTGVMSTSDSTESSTTSTGSIITAGGIGIAKALRVGNGIYGTIQTASQPNITSIGTLSSLTIGTTTINEAEIVVLDNATAGTAVASKVLVLDASRNITNINSLTTTTLVLGTISLTTTEATYLTSITAGTGAASKALVLDASRNITNINSLTTTTLVLGTISLTSSQAAYLTSITAGTGAASKALVLDASRNITNINSLTTTTLVLGTTSLTTTEATYLTSITAGTGAASKALVLDASRNITNINSLTTTQLVLGGVTLTSTQANMLTGISLGGVTASKIVTVDSFNDVSGFRSMYFLNGSSYSPITASLNSGVSIALQLGSTGYNYWGPTTAHGFSLQTNNQGALFISSAGNISIGGSNNSTYKLNVQGALNCSQLYIGDVQFTPSSQTLSSVLVDKIGLNQNTISTTRWYAFDNSASPQTLLMYTTNGITGDSFGSICARTSSGSFAVQDTSDRTLSITNTISQCWVNDWRGSSFRNQLQLRCAGGTTSNAEWMWMSSSATASTDTMSWKASSTSATPALYLQMADRRVSINSSTIDSLSNLDVNGTIRGRQGLWLGDVAMESTSLTERKIVSLQSNMTAGNRATMILGRSLQNVDCGIIGYTWQGSNSTSNRLSLGFFGADNILSITAGNRVGINTTTPRCPLDVNLTDSLTFAPGGGSYQLYQHNTIGAPIVSQSIASAVGPYFLSNVSALFSGIVFCQSIWSQSDFRLKENITPIDIDLERYKMFNPVSYNYKSDANKKQKIGLIAQEAAEIAFEVVELIPNKDLDDGIQLNIDYNQISIINMSVIQQLIKQISQLQDSIAKLEKR